MFSLENIKPPQEETDALACQSDQIQLQNRDTLIAWSDACALQNNPVCRLTKILSLVNRAKTLYGINILLGLALERNELINEVSRAIFFSVAVPFVRASAVPKLSSVVPCKWFLLVVCSKF